MNTQDLHTKFRPKKFYEVIGQDHVINSLVALFKKKKQPHAYLFTGSSGCGKCVVGTTLIPSDEGLLPINHFDCGYGYNPFSLNISAKVGIKATEFYYKELVTQTVKVTNSLGLTLEGTLDHPILIINKDLDLIFKKLSEINVGDYVVIRKNTQHFVKKNPQIIFTQPIMPNDGHSKRLTLPEYFNENIAELLGYLIANGCNTTAKENTGIAFSSKNTILKNRVFEIMRSLGVTKSFKDYGGNERDYRLGGVWLHRFITYLLDERLPTARFKKVPKIILQSTKSCQAAFLRALFDCDSSYYKGIIEYTSASQILVEQLQVLLLNFGIISTHTTKTVKNYDHVYHKLTITSRYVDIYFKEINSLKFNKIEKTRNPNKEGLPFTNPLGAYLATLRKALNHSKNGMVQTPNGTIRFPTSFGKLIDWYISNTNKLLTLQHAKLILEEYKQFCVLGGLKQNFQFTHKLNHLLLDDNFYYSPITKIEYNNNITDVYDFHIPNTHTFVSNGFISHNTTLSRIVASELGCNEHNIIEIDAASFSGVDNIRELTQSLNYSTFGKNPNKFIILDEVHALSRAAFQALLKTLEEPPEHVYFALCTTEADKVPDTIKTRCHTYNLKDVNYDDLIALLEFVAKEESINFEDHDKALRVIAQASLGSPRRALTFLSKCRGCEDLASIKLILEEPDEDGEVIELCRMLVGRVRPQWRNVIRILSSIQNQNAESVRLIVVNYVSKVLLNSKTDKDALKLLGILDAFSTPCNQSEKFAPLLLALGQIVFGEDE